MRCWGLRVEGGWAASCARLIGKSGGIFLAQALCDAIALSYSASRKHARPFDALNSIALNRCAWMHGFVVQSHLHTEPERANATAVWSSHGVQAERAR
ncbi:hypothetical protein PCAR4_570299 [Paraburkholderia caribensis]|nr:hypothetical protein PCAR4_570299 [Paraburkholderia caribensis]